MGRLTPNTVFTETGWLRVSKNRVPPFDLSRPLEAQVKSELLVDYRSDFWDWIDELGKRSRVCN